MAEQIQIEVTLDGAEQATRGAESISAGLEGMARTTTTVAQRVQGVAGAIQGLTSAMGSRDRTAGLVASVAGATAQFAAMGSILGPTGAIAGAVVGLAHGLMQLADSANEAAQGAREAGESYRDLGRRLLEAQEAMRRSIDFERYLETGISERTIEMSELEEELAGRRAELQDVISARARALVERDADQYRVLSERERALASSIELLTQRIAENNAAIASAEANTADLPSGVDMPDASFTRPTRRGGSGPREPTLDELMERALNAGPRFTDMLSEIADGYAALANEAGAAADEITDAMAAQEQHALGIQTNVSMVEDAMASMQEMVEESADANSAASSTAVEESRNMAEELLADFQGIAGNTSKLLTRALIDVASGAKSAEDAFSGMLKSFLEMISEYAMLKAATEFAEAIGSFARYDMGGGAQHLAAGVAFTAVAVATGVGAAAINTGKPTAPARPTGGQENDRGSEKQTVVVNYNSPVVTAQTEAELGRGIAGMVDTGRRRFGGR